MFKLTFVRRLPNAGTRWLFGGRVRSDAALLGVRGGQAAALPSNIHYY